jgi:hypothetical protein
VLLAYYVAVHGKGRWDALRGAEANGEERAPDLRRGGMTEEERLLILELHARWGKAMCCVRRGEVRSRVHSPSSVTQASSASHPVSAYIGHARSMSR